MTKVSGAHSVLAIIFVVALVLSKNPIDAVRRADSTLDARRVATFVTAERGGPLNSDSLLTARGASDRR